MAWDLSQYHGEYGSRVGVNTSSLGYSLRIEMNGQSAEISAGTTKSIDGADGTTKIGDHEVLGVFHMLKLMRVSGNVIEIVEP